MYQQTRLSDTSAIGAPGPLPECIATWGNAPEILADMTGQAPAEFGFDGTGFWPVLVTTPAFDATKRILAGTVTMGKVDPFAKAWAATADVRDLTMAEIAAANPVPDQVTNYQARAALVAAGLFAKVDGAIHGADMTVQSNLVAAQAWDYANMFLRASPFIAALQGGLGLTSAQVDDLFRAAAKVS